MEALGLELNGNDIEGFSLAILLGIALVILLKIRSTRRENNSLMLKTKDLRALGLTNAGLNDIFLKKEKYRIQSAADETKELSSLMKIGSKELTQMEASMEAKSKQLDGIIQEIKAKQSKIQKDIIIKNKVTNLLQSISAEQKLFSAEINSMAYLEHKHRFLDQVRRGYPKKQVIDNLVSKSIAQLETDTMLSEVMAARLDELSLGLSEQLLVDELLLEDRTE